MLFVKFDAGSERIRLSGKAEVIDDPAEFSDLPGAKRILRVTADYIFYNSLRSIPSMKLIEQSPYLPREGYTRPQPQWKRRDYILYIIDE